MKLFMNKNEKYEEPEVHMFFHKQTKEVEQVEKFVRSLTYLYTASRVYESSENLLSLEKLLEAAGFIRVRKNCIINKYKLRSMMISKNSHIEAVLGNDEHIVVTRSYIAGIKEAFAR